MKIQSNIIEKQWKSMESNKNPWNSVKIDEEPLKINEK